MENETKKIAIVGITGLVGSSVLEVLSEETDFSIVGISNKEINLELSRQPIVHQIPYDEIKLIRKVLVDEKPNIIINCVGSSDETYCEENKKEAWKINYELVSNLASVAKIHSSYFITFSCDSVFDGKTGHYPETAKPDPRNYLGKAKLAAENFVITSNINYTIIRLPLVYGLYPYERNDIVAKLVEILKKEKLYELEFNYFTNPIFADDVAWGILKLINSPYQGILHFGGGTYLSFGQFADAIAKVFDIEDAKIPSPQNSRSEKRGLDETFAQTLLNIRFSTIMQGLTTYKYLTQQKESPFESLPRRL